MEIEDNIVRVGRDEAMESLKPKLNGYRRFWSRIYIGVTANPEGRCVKHARKGWRKMVLLYDAYTPEIAYELERDLIDYAGRCGFLLPIENINPGGEGIGSARRSNYLYVLVG